ncbi:hypothetical protein VMCG_02839 [Cytospora schulzeri]|uniref:Uncharacterized protein n=1 Tax=Cytospora schulzeri TaxID=448051 RepID=A0A423WZS4_9PEZI|nr:hypothetical protein VMCG_02839 [Valsa malicola]
MPGILEILGILVMLRATGILVETLVETPEGTLEIIGTIGTIESTGSGHPPDKPRTAEICPGTCRLSPEQLRWLGSKGNVRSSKSHENLEFGW